MTRPFPALLLSLLLFVPGCGDDSTPSGDADVPADEASDVPPEDSADVDALDALDDGADAEASCGTCHGRDDRPNPPPDLAGETAQTARGVGAHEAHLATSDWRAAVHCSHCHTVPEGVDAPGHIDAARPADVVFSGLAARGVDPQRDGERCTVYCHGGAMRIDPRESGAWTATDGTACTSCHGLPPAAPHPPASDCGRCHLVVADETGAIVEPLFHIDSVIAAPHGAHLVHLGGNDGSDFPCTTCHPDGEAYHGPLRDGRTLEETTVCDPCHAAGSVDAAAWRGYDPYPP